MNKKWFFPAVYLTAAALILAFITWYQSPDDYAIDPDEIGYDGVEEEWGDEGNMDAMDPQDEEAMPVAAQEEEMQSPVSDQDGVDIVIGFFDDEASEEEQQAAMVEYEQSYQPNQGFDFAHVDGESFEVHAAMSGTVVDAGKDPLVGNYVEIDHGEELVTVYQGLEDVQVTEGDEIHKSDVIGQSGRSVFRKDLGPHVHFEVREQGEAVNPGEYLPVSSPESAEQEEVEAEENEGNENMESEETEANEQSDVDENNEADNQTQNG